MASASGVTCDACEKFETVPGAVPIPPGWMQLVIHGQGRGKETLDLCSNKCVRDMGRRRIEAEKELAGSIPREPEKERNGMSRGEAAFKARHVRFHTNKGIVEDGCLWCEAETNPAVGE